MIRTLLLLPSCWAVLSAQNAGVTGLVTNAVTGDPVLRAHVLLRAAKAGPDSAQSYGALTNTAGKFTIAPLPAGAYVVTVERIGFVPPNHAHPPNMVTVSEGGMKEELKLSLTPTGAITGRILDSRGEPVFRASVIAERGSFNAQAVTDEQGRYRIGGLSPGAYRVRATPETLPLAPEIRTDGTRPVHYSTTYYPNSPTRGEGGRIELQPGAQVGGIDIRMFTTPFVVVSGKVSDIPAGGERTTIQAWRADGMVFGVGWLPRTLKPDGTFAIGDLDPGKYTLIATAVGLGRQPDLQIGELDIEVAGVNIEHLNLHAIAPFEVRGLLRFDDDQKRLPKGGAPRKIQLSAVDRFPGASPRAEIAPDDSFALETVPPARYRVMLSWPAGYVRSVRAGSVEMEGNILDLRNGAPGPVVISMGSIMGQISGTVTAADGSLANAHVVLVSASHSLNFMPIGADGTYTFTDLAPGKYQLAAVPEGFYANQPRASDPLEEYQDVAVTVELAAGDKVKQELKRK